MRLAFTVLLAASLALPACATKPVVYGPISEAQPFGYRDWPNTDGGRTVLVVVPPHSSLVQAREFWDKRAAELCPQGIAKRNVFRSDRTEAMGGAPYVYNGVGVGGRYQLGFQVQGYLYCKT